MILNTGCRTDVPAFYSKWFYNRIKEGFVCTRNPYYPELVMKYKLSPDVVDVLCFCTKNPQPMLARLFELNSFRQFWFVTLTPYGKEIEPLVPDKNQVLDSILQLSSMVGSRAVAWRYDPIFITDRYSISYHLRAFGKIASILQNKISFCVISFLDLYEKTKRNFPSARKVEVSEQKYLVPRLAEIGIKYGIPIRTCCEDPSLAQYGVDVSGCRTREVLEEAIGCNLIVTKKKKSPRSQCDCLLGSDIGRYDTCPHGCVYCYANDNQEKVKQNRKLHDSNSPFLIGGFREGDKIVEVQQESYLDSQMSLF